MILIGAQKRATRRRILPLLGGMLAASAVCGQCPGLVPSFTWNSDSASIRFIDRTEDLGLGVDSIRWDFGDGGTTGEASPAWHTYASGGADTVSMMIWSESCAFSVQAFVAHGNGDDVCTLLVEPSYAAWQPSNNVVEFTNTSFTGGLPFQSAWSFGDDALSLDPTPSHIYPTPGPYAAALSLLGTDTTTSDGCIAGMVRLLQVDGNASTCDTSLFVDFTYTFDGATAVMTSGIIPLDPGLIVQEFSWSFGDFSASLMNMEEPVHFYTYPGEYQVCLSVLAADAIDTADHCGGEVCRTLEPNVVGVAEVWTEGPLQVHPNPFLDRTTISDDRLAGEVRITVFDLAGQVLEERRVNGGGGVELGFSNLTPGEYLLHAVDQRHSLWSRMVKQ